MVDLHLASLLKYITIVSQLFEKEILWILRTFISGQQLDRCFLQNSLNCLSEIQHKIYITFNQGTTTFIFSSQPGDKYFSLGETKKKTQVFEDGLSLKILVVILVLIFGIWAQKFQSLLFIYPISVFQISCLLSLLVILHPYKKFQRAAVSRIQLMLLGFLKNLLLYWHYFEFFISNFLSLTKTRFLSALFIGFQITLF